MAQTSEVYSALLCPRIVTGRSTKLLKLRLRDGALVGGPSFLQGSQTDHFTLVTPEYACLLIDVLHSVKVSVEGVGIDHCRI